MMMVIMVMVMVMGMVVEWELVLPSLRLLRKGVGRTWWRGVEEESGCPERKRVCWVAWLGGRVCDLGGVAWGVCVIWMDVMRI